MAGFRSSHPGRLAPLAAAALAVLLLVALGACSGSSDSSAEEDGAATPAITRLADNPVIRPEMLPGDDGANINGPSLIRVPPWVENPLGRYYLYFAHHAGRFIRLAYADQPTGPWTVHPPGTLRVDGTICDDITGSSYADYEHVASPDVHVDEAARRIRMYFHCPVYVSGPKDSDDSYRQVTLLALSQDGLDFEAGSEPLGNSYFRVFEWQGWTYAIGMPGVFYRSRDGLGAFEEGPTLFTPDMRHSAVTVRDGRLQVFYTLAGDNPERILHTVIDLSPDWSEWRAAPPRPVLEPELDWEGADLPLRPSERGLSAERVRQLRDPALFVDGDRTYLLYSVAGESGIAIATVEWP